MVIFRFWGRALLTLVENIYILSYRLGDCYDDEYRCLKWAKSGECNKNPDYMLQKCRQSCDVCQGK